MINEMWCSCYKTLFLEIILILNKNWAKTFGLAESHSDPP